MTKFKVTYTIRHTRIFDVPNQAYIHKLLNEDNECVVENIELYEDRDDCKCDSPWVQRNKGNKA